MRAKEIFRFTVIRPIQKKDSEENKGFTGRHTGFPINLEDSIYQTLWEEELYVLIGKIIRFAHVEEIKGPINRTRAHKAIVGPELSALELEQIGNKAIRQTINITSDLQAIYNGYNYQILVDTDFEFEHVAQEAKYMAYNFAKEVIDRFASGITEIVKKQRAAITKEINEINLGKIDYDLSANEETFLWSDEIRNAQLVSLGKILRYDTLKPRPAVFLYYSQNKTQDDLQEKWRDAVIGEGFLSVKNKSKDVVGVGTRFVEEDDENRELIIRGEKYIIAKVESYNKVILKEEYAGEDEEEVEYIKSVKYVGDPWDFTIPTSGLLLIGRFLCGAQKR